MKVLIRFGPKNCKILKRPPVLSLDTDVSLPSWNAGDGKFDPRILIENLQKTLLLDSIIFNASTYQANAYEDAIVVSPIEEK
jgi:hypothetical protein